MVCQVIGEGVGVGVSTDVGVVVPSATVGM